MAEKIFLFPGQGAQQVGMGKDVYEASPAAKAVFDKADEILGFPLSELCFNGPQEKLTEARHCQPAILTTSIAVLEALREKKGEDAAQCEAAAGLSLGEYTALVAAGALDFADGVKLVHERGRLMEEAAVGRDGTMASVIGLDDDTVKDLCTRATKGTVVAANFNSPGQVVISGDRAAVEEVSKLAEEAGARQVIPLRVSGAFHSPLMTPAKEKLETLLREVDFHPGRCRVIANVSAEYVQEPEEIRDALIRQLDHSVLWSMSMQRLLADYPEAKYYEIGPGRVLAGLMRRISRPTRVTVINGIAGIEKLG